MVKISILYPHRKGGRFDMDYYMQRHVPRAVALFGPHPGYHGVSVERGLSGGAPGSDPAFTVVFSFLFESLPAFVAASKAVGNELQLDMPNYTDAVPVMQISEVVNIG
ncbi:EthD family reductase [Cupriavidus sp. CuC1]|uniref:EthD family reductase n=1 Tax=Cupriavidus sp. CuC1 TaxID=3373131 RepID=UPI0037D289E8